MGHTDIHRVSVGRSGPIVKDKLFFFAIYDGMRDRRSYAAYSTVPTAAMKQGDISATGTKIYDPATGDQTNGRNRTVFADGIIPNSRINSVARTMLDLMPDPNISGTFVNNHYTAAPWNFNRDMYDFKVDWVRSARNTIWFKYSLMNSKVVSQYRFGEAGGSNLGPDSGAGEGTVRVDVGTLGGRCSRNSAARSLPTFFSPGPMRTIARCSPASSAGSPPASC